METKSLRFEMKSISDSGEFEGYASTRKKDSYGDIVAPNAFKRTIDHQKGSFPILWMHDVSQPIGLSTYMEEDEKGLYTKGQIDLDIELGKNVYSGMKKGYIDRMSIGYRTKQEDYDKEQDARILKEVQLLEYSMITKNFAANDAALLTAVKSHDPLYQLLTQLTELTKAQQESMEILQRLLQADPLPRTQPKSINNKASDNTDIRDLINEMTSFVRSGN